MRDVTWIWAGQRASCAASCPSCRDCEGLYLSCCGQGHVVPAEQSWCPFCPPPPPRVTVICESSRGCDWLTVLPRTSFLGPWGRPGVICLPSSTCLLFSHSVVSSSLRPPWTAADQAPLSSIISWSLLGFMSIELMILSNHLILCYPLLLCPQSFPASRSFPMSQLFASDGQRIEASASVLPMNIQGWVPLGLTVWAPWSPRDSQESSPISQFKSINSLAPLLNLGDNLVTKDSLITKWYFPREPKPLKK